MNFHVVIPARFASTRFAGKPLCDLAGKPMIQHVYERCSQSGAKSVIIATDDERIQQAAAKFQAEVCMTSPTHPTGSDRIAEAITQLGLADDTIIVNVQGDQPLIPPGIIRQVAANLSHYQQAAMATLCVPIHEYAELTSPSIVKVVRDENEYALYFSRAIIPWHRDSFKAYPDQFPANTAYFRHIGIYAYRVGFIKQFIQWPQSEIECVESLEQLRVLSRGERIHCAVANESPAAEVDTEEDYLRVNQLLSNM